MHCQVAFPYKGERYDGLLSCTSFSQSMIIASQQRTSCCDAQELCLICAASVESNIAYVPLFCCAPNCRHKPDPRAPVRVLQLLFPSGLPSSLVFPQKKGARKLMGARRPPFAFHQRPLFPDSTNGLGSGRRRRSLRPESRERRAEPHLFHTGCMVGRTTFPENKQREGKAVAISWGRAPDNIQL